jgi:hypothetical protein
MTEDKPELETETAPETAPEPIAEPATAVVTRAEIILDRLAAQQQRILDELRRLDDGGAIADQLRTVLDSQRTLQHDVTVLSGLLPTVAHAQTSILDQIAALDANLRGLGRVLAGFVDQMAAVEASIERWEASRLTAAKTPG